MVSPLLWGVCGNVHAPLLLPPPLPAAAAVLPGADAWDMALCCVLTSSTSFSCSRRFMVLRRRTRGDTGGNTNHI
jgi:hypothetical protein